MMPSWRGLHLVTTTCSSGSIYNQELVASSCSLMRWGVPRIPSVLSTKSNSAGSVQGIFKSSVYCENIAAVAFRPVLSCPEFGTYA